MYGEDDRMTGLNLPTEHVARYATILELKIYQESRTIQGYNDEVKAQIELLELAQGHFHLWKNFLLSHFPNKKSSESPVDIPNIASKSLLSFKTMRLAQDYIKYAVRRINAALPLRAWRADRDPDWDNLRLSYNDRSVVVIGLVWQLRASRTRWVSLASFIEAVAELESKIELWRCRRNWSAWGEQVRLHAKTSSSTVLPSSNTTSESDIPSDYRKRSEFPDQQNARERKMRKLNPPEYVDEGKNLSRDPGNKPSAQEANLKTVKRKPLRLKPRRSEGSPSAISTGSAAPPSSLPHRPDTTDGLEFDLAGLQSRHQSQTELHLDLAEHRSRLQSSPQLGNRHSLPQSEFKFRSWTPLEISPSQRRSYDLKVGKGEEDVDGLSEQINQMTLEVDHGKKKIRRLNEQIKKMQFEAGKDQEAMRERRMQLNLLELKHKATLEMAELKVAEVKSGVLRGRRSRKELELRKSALDARETELIEKEREVRANILERADALDAQENKLREKERKFQAHVQEREGALDARQTKFADQENALHAWFEKQNDAHYARKKELEERGDAVVAHENALGKEESTLWDILKERYEALDTKEEELGEREHALDAREAKLRERESVLQAQVQGQARKSLQYAQENTQRLRQAQIDLKNSEAAFLKLTSDPSTSVFSTSDLRAALASIK
jgi:hypothetical protein